MGYLFPRTGGRYSQDMNPHELITLVDALTGTTAAYYVGVLIFIPLGLALLGLT